MPIRTFHLLSTRRDAVQTAPILRAMQKHGDFAPQVVAAGDQDAGGWSPAVLAELGLPAPDQHLPVGGGDETPTTVTARLLIAGEQALLAAKPDLVVVIGDSATALALAIAAVKLRIPVAHVEAGLRSPQGHRSPELNRRLIDRIAAWLFAPSPAAGQNLRAEGHPPGRIHAIGNVLIDALLEQRSAAARSPVLATHGLAPQGYAVLALDRDAMHDPAQLSAVLEALSLVPAEIPLIWWAGSPRPHLPLDRLRILDPLGYLDSLRLLEQARFVLTDAGAIQEESTALQVPCLTLSDATDRPLTVSEGSNLLVGLDPERIAAESRKILRGEGKSGRVPAFWDGRAAERMVAVLAQGAPAWSLDEALSEP